MIRSLVVWLVLTSAVIAAEPDPQNPIYADLLKVRSGIVDAYNQKDLDALLDYCHRDIVVTWQNGEVTEGHEGIRRYHDKMLKGPERVVESMTVAPEVDKLAVLHGDSLAISRGAMNDHYRLTDGSEFSMHSRWSTTLVKQGDRWLIASFHASVPAFDNEILHLAVASTAKIVAVGSAAIVAIIAGTLIWLTRRRRVTS